MVTAATKLKDTVLERKAMTNLDRVLKSRDITLPTKVCILKAMFFPVLVYVNIWKLMVHILLKPGLENFEHYFTSV